MSEMRDMIDCFAKMCQTVPVDDLQDMIMDYLAKMIQTVPVDDLKRQLTNEQIVEIVKDHLDADVNVGFLILNHNVYAVCSDGLVAIEI